MCGFALGFLEDLAGLLAGWERGVSWACARGMGPAPGAGRRPGGETPGRLRVRVPAPPEGETLKIGGPFVFPRFYRGVARVLAPAAPFDVAGGVRTRRGGVFAWAPLTLGCLRGALGCARVGLQCGRNPAQHSQWGETKVNSDFVDVSNALLNLDTEKELEDGSTYRMQNTAGGKNWCHSDLSDSVYIVISDSETGWPGSRDEISDHPVAWRRSVCAPGENGGRCLGLCTVWR